MPQPLQRTGTRKGKSSLLLQKLGQKLFTPNSCEATD